MDKVNFSNIAFRYKDYSMVQKSVGDILLNLLRIGDNDDVLDLRCGTGNLTRKIREAIGGTVFGHADNNEEVELIFHRLFLGAIKE